MCAVSLVFAMLAGISSPFLPLSLLPPSCAFHCKQIPTSCLRNGTGNRFTSGDIFLSLCSGIAPVKSQSVVAQLCMAYAAPVNQTEQCSDCCSSQAGPSFDLDAQCKNTHLPGSGMAGCQDPYFGGIAGCCFVEKADVCLPCEKASVVDKNCWSVADTCARRCVHFDVLRL